MDSSDDQSLIITQHLPITQAQGEHKLPWARVRVPLKLDI